MFREHFFSAKSLENIIVNRKITTDGKKVNWFNIQCIINERENPFLLKYIDYHDGNKNVTNIVSLKKKNVQSTFMQTILMLLYQNEKKISKNKYEDLQLLKAYIPPNCHEFYDSLKFKEVEDVDYSLADSESEDPEESQF